MGYAKAMRLWSVAALAACLMGSPARADKKPTKKLSQPPLASLTDRKRAIHVLSRFTFGVRPGDLDAVMAMGVEQWFERQLNPMSIDDGLMESRLANLRTLKMSSRDLVQAFPNNAVIRSVAEGKAPMPSDPYRRAMYEVQVANYKDSLPKAKPADAVVDPTAKALQEKKSQDDASRIAASILGLPRESRMGAICSLPIEQRRMLVTSLRGPQRDQLLAEFPPDQRELFLAMNGPTGVVTGELQQAKLLRAVYSERQLQEVMTDFWVNHFNVFLYKDADQYYLTSYERDVIRPRALGSFKDLLLATSESPAMLFYLDNWASIGPNSPAANPAGRNTAPKPGQQQPGLNENYGRELLELHTLGVDGGYTQKDVTEAARIFTGWTIDHPELGGNFVFDPRKHEPGPKIVLGVRIEGGGQDEGLRLIDMLARSPATAKFVCTKIARRFVADDPPPSLVQQMAQTFLTKNGDIREVLRTMFHAKEFWAPPQAYRAKVKTPLEFIASAVRATGASVDNPGPLLGTLSKMGMPLYGQQPPTGYPMVAQAWINSDELVDRLNFALQMTQGQIGGVRFDSQRVLALGVLTTTRVAPANLPPNDPVPGPQHALALLEDALLNGEVSPQTHSAIDKELQDPQLTGKILADPSGPLGK